ncbi:flagellin lysine-N-methylase [Brevibacillus sp. H7]|uniref:flagellin lysine-N-methylase n=1 Tax=Brevibacillus sp. H7 TaxID=3349138 RepID=UPI0038039E20
MKQSHLAASYMKQFQCIGTACEDTCCQGWSVDIDKKTFVKYKQLTDKTWKKKLTHHIRRNRYETTFTDYATIRFNEHGFCPFLNTEKLCSIQLGLGERYLSRTCSLYPRQHSRLYNTYELFGSLSCPEVARLALLNPDGIRLEPVDTVCEDDSSLDRLFDDERFSDCYYEIRSYIVELLQNRSISLHSRMFRLGRFSWDLSQLMEEKRFIDILPILARYRELPDDDENDVMNTLTSSEFHLQLLLYFVEDYAENSGNNQRYKNYYQQFQQGIDGSIERHQRAYEVYFVPFLQEHGYVLENYLVNYVYSRLFPLFGNRSVYDEYVVFLLHYVLIQLHLIGIAASQQGLSAEEAVSFIQTFSRMYEHDSSYFVKALDILNEKELTGLDDLAQLLNPALSLK